MSNKQSSKKNKGIPFTVMIAAAVVMFWRGMWGLMDLYLFPNSLPLSYVVSLILGFAILYITHYIFEELL